MGGRVGGAWGGQWGEGDGLWHRLVCILYIITLFSAFWGVAEFPGVSNRAEVARARPDMVQFAQNYSTFARIRPTIPDSVERRRHMLLEIVRTRQHKVAETNHIPDKTRLVAKPKTH